MLGEIHAMLIQEVQEDSRDFQDFKDVDGFIFVPKSQFKLISLSLS